MRVVTGALEIERKEKRLGSSLQAHPKIHADAAYRRALEGVDLAEVAITSGATLVDGPPTTDGFTVAEVPGVTVMCEIADGTRCERCWRVLPEVGHSGQDGESDDLCGRCTTVIAEAVDTPPAA